MSRRQRKSPRSPPDQSVCIGELVIERQATHQEVVEVSQTLKEVLNADIFSVKPTSDGVSISCRVRDVSSFLSSLPGYAESYRVGGRVPVA